MKQVWFTVGSRSSASAEVRDIGLWQSLHESPSVSWIEPAQWMRPPAAWQPRHTSFCSSTGATDPRVKATIFFGSPPLATWLEPGPWQVSQALAAGFAARGAAEHLGVDRVVPVLGLELWQPRQIASPTYWGSLGSRRVG